MANRLWTCACRLPEVVRRGAADRAGSVRVGLGRIEHVRASPAPYELLAQPLAPRYQSMSLVPAASRSCDGTVVDQSVLLLFDIDGTLLHGTTRPVGEAMRRGAQRGAWDRHRARSGRRSRRPAGPMAKSRGRSSSERRRLHANGSTPSPRRVPRRCCRCARPAAPGRSLVGGASRCHASCSTG